MRLLFDTFETNHVDRVVEAIYTQESRYLYELIQNADDAHYKLATENSEDPTEIHAMLRSAFGRH